MSGDEEDGVNCVRISGAKKDGDGCCCCVCKCSGSRKKAAEEDDDELMVKCMQVLNATESVTGELYVTGIKLLLGGDKAWKKMFLLVPHNRVRDLLAGYHYGTD